MAVDLSKPMELHRQGRHGEALPLYRAALEQAPQDPDILYLTGLCQLEMGEMEAGAQQMRALVAIQPRNAAAHHALGKALIELGKNDAARSHLQNALDINPNSSDSRIELADLALATGDAKRAGELYREGIKIDPSQPALWNNLGTVCRQLGQLKEAEEAWVKTIGLAPDLVEAYCNIATLKVRLGRFSEGISYLQDGLERRPDDPDLNFYLGELHFFAGEFEGASDALKRALASRTGFRDAEIRLAQASQYLCDWDTMDAFVTAIRQEIDNAIAGGECSISPFFGVTLDTTEAERTAVAAAETRKREAQLAPLSSEVNFSFERPAKSRIHIGYLSGDWRDHAASHLACGLFRHHDRTSFEVSVLSYGPDDSSEYLQRIRNGAENFVDLSEMNDLEAAHKIYESGVDILLDVQGFMGNARPEIWMLKPAPIQISYLTYLGSLGAQELNYIIADPTMIDFVNREAFTESVITMPACYQVNDDEARIGKKPTRREEGLSDDAVVFCAIHGGHKITRDIYACWMRILKAVPDSILWLAASGPLRDNLTAAAISAGIDAQSRLVFARRLPDKADHLARLALADLFLDTPIYGAHSSAVDCLWVGTPVLTAPGPVFSSRGAATLLKNLGVKELIATDYNDYEQKAIHLGKTAEERTRLRNLIAHNQKTAPLFDTALWVQNIERAYQEIWARHQRGEAPSDLSLG
ncbi:MAG: hypothetical protein CMM52_15785 [Rhodospirillaceae bacterium]|nr:hypothetical protein [Rhodospirillaceae bacterium]|tara:strand:- start:22039 stop:24135 length:2097 start_codon:yes stop_codon:yes gene_type:complete